jgi:hypothetical protein
VKPTGWAGRAPSRAFRSTVLGCILRKRAASSALTGLSRTERGERRRLGVSGTIGLGWLDIGVSQFLQDVLPRSSFGQMLAAMPSGSRRYEASPPLHGGHQALNHLRCSETGSCSFCAAFPFHMSRNDASRSFVMLTGFVPCLQCARPSGANESLPVRSAPESSRGKQRSYRLGPKESLGGVKMFFAETISAGCRLDSDAGVPTSTIFRLREAGQRKPSRV